MGSTPFLSDMVNLPEEPRAAGEPHAAHLGLRGRADPARAGAAGQGRDEPRRALLLGHDRERRPHHHAQERPAGEGVRDRRPRAAGQRGARGRRRASARCRPTPSATCRRAGSRIFVGYLKKPQLNSIDADGWFDTGDLARMDQRRLHPHRRPHQGRHHPRRREHPRRRGREPASTGIPRWPNAPSWPCRTSGSASAAAPS